MQQQAEAELDEAVLELVVPACAAGVGPAPAGGVTLRDQEAERGHVDRMLKGVGVGDREILEREHRIAAGRDRLGDQLDDRAELADRGVGQHGARLGSSPGAAEGALEPFERDGARLLGESRVDLDALAEAVLDVDGVDASPAERLDEALLDGHPLREQWH